MLASLEGPEAGSDCIKIQYARKCCSVVGRRKARSCSLKTLTGNREMARLVEAGWSLICVSGSHPLKNDRVGHLTHLDN